MACTARTRAACGVPVRRTNKVVRINVAVNLPFTVWLLYDFVQQAGRTREGGHRRLRPAQGVLGGRAPAHQAGPGGSSDLHLPHRLERIHPGAGSDRSRHAHVARGGFPLHRSTAGHRWPHGWRDRGVNAMDNAKARRLSHRHPRPDLHQQPRQHAGLPPRTAACWAGSACPRRSATSALAGRRATRSTSPPAHRSTEPPFKPAECLDHDP